MRKILLLAIAIVAQVSLMAQTVTEKIENDMTVTYDQSLTGTYKLVWNKKSDKVELVHFNGLDN